MMETDQALLNHYLERETSNNSEDAGEEIIDAGLISDLVIQMCPDFDPTKSSTWTSQLEYIQNQVSTNLGFYLEGNQQPDPHVATKLVKMIETNLTGVFENEFLSEVVDFKNYHKCSDETYHMEHLLRYMHKVRDQASHFHMFHLNAPHLNYVECYTPGKKDSKLPCVSEKAVEFRIIGQIDAIPKGQQLEFQITSSQEHMRVHASTFYYKKMHDSDYNYDYLLVQNGPIEFSSTSGLKEISLTMHCTTLKLDAPFQRCFVIPSNPSSQRAVTKRLVYQKELFGRNSNGDTASIYAVLNAFQDFLVYITDQRFDIKRLINENEFKCMLDTFSDLKRSVATNRRLLESQFITFWNEAYNWISPLYASNNQSVTGKKKTLEPGTSILDCFIQGKVSLLTAPHARKVINFPGNRNNGDFLVGICGEPANENHLFFAILENDVPKAILMHPEHRDANFKLMDFISCTNYEEFPDPNRTKFRNGLKRMLVPENSCDLKYCGITPTSNKRQHTLNLDEYSSCI
jgi:hypothetical protein